MHAERARYNLLPNTLEQREQKVIKQGRGHPACAFLSLSTQSENPILAPRRIGA